MDGPIERDVAAARQGLEGIVSKRRVAPYAGSGVQRGEIINLQRSFRLRLARYGFVLEHSELALFKPVA